MTKSVLKFWLGWQSLLTNLMNFYDKGGTTKICAPVLHMGLNEGWLVILGMENE